MMNTIKKDNLVILFIGYFSVFCFWLFNRNSARRVFDLYLFVGALVVMCVLPIVILEIRNRRLV